MHAATLVSVTRYDLLLQTKYLLFEDNGDNYVLSFDDKWIPEHVNISPSVDVPRDNNNNNNKRFIPRQYPTVQRRLQEKNFQLGNLLSEGNFLI